MSTATILCIDDEALGLQIRRTVLEHAGYRVLTAEDGPSGLNLFRGHAIDGVVLDYFMPDIVQKHGGAIRIGNSADPSLPGACIRVFLPARTYAHAPLEKAG